MKLQAGYYGSQDLEATREWLYREHGIIPKVSLDHKGKLVRLRAALTDGWAVIEHEDAEHAAEVAMYL